jgi:hypothetical protein
MIRSNVPIRRLTVRLFGICIFRDMKFVVTPGIYWMSDPALRSMQRACLAFKRFLITLYLFFYVGALITLYVHVCV